MEKITMQQQGSLRGVWEHMEYASNEIWNMEHEHEKGNTGHSPYMKSGIWDQESYPIMEYYGKRENMKLGTWNKVILKFELGNLQGP